jgi:hypothetical protein
VYEPALTVAAEEQLGPFILTFSASAAESPPPQEESR